MTDTLVSTECLGCRGTDPVIIHTADYHLDNGRVSSSKMADNIRTHLFKELPGADMLCIAGDVFDGSVKLDDDDVPIILDLFSDLIQECFVHSVVIRILQGTYSHDRMQLRAIDNMYKRLSIPVDYAWVNKLSFEYIEGLNLRIIYMPDNLPFRSKSDILSAVSDLLLVNNVETVDYVVVHGEFSEVGVPSSSRIIYSVSDFDFCSKLILAGHIHKPGKYGKLVYAGSFDRIAHNEEEPKGYWLIRGTKVKFIENTHATKFITKDYCQYTTINGMITEHDRIVDGLNEYDNVRVLIKDPHMRHALSTHHTSKYPNITLKFKRVSSTQASKSYITDRLRVDSIGLEVPTHTTIAHIISTHLSSKNIDMNIDDITTVLNIQRGLT